MRFQTLNTKFRFEELHEFTNSKVVGHLISLSDLSLATKEFIAHFAQFRINGVKVEWRPAYNVIGLTGQSPGISGLKTSVTRDMGFVWAKNMEQFYDHGSLFSSPRCHRIRGNQYFSQYVKLKTPLKVGMGTSTNVDIMFKQRPFINSTDVAADFGKLWICASDSMSDVDDYTVNPIGHLAFTYYETI